MAHPCEQNSVTDSMTRFLAYIQRKKENEQKLKEFGKSIEAIETETQAARIEQSAGTNDSEASPQRQGQNYLARQVVVSLLDPNSTNSVRYRLKKSGRAQAPNLFGTPNKTQAQDIPTTLERGTRGISGAVSMQANVRSV